MKFFDLFKSSFVLIGVVHLTPMPGFSGTTGLANTIDFALREAKTLEMAGFDGVLIENEGDRPHPLKVDEEYIRNFVKLIQAVNAGTHLKVGLEILYDMPGTIQCGVQAAADFIRLDIFTDDTETKWGIVKSCTQDFENFKRVNSDKFPALMADVHVKHGINLSGRSLAESSQLAHKNGADALIVTGTITGVPPTLEDCSTIQSHGGSLPLLVGSGFNIENADSFSKYCNGAVVASSIKKNDRLDLELCAKLAAKVKALFKNKEYND